MKYKVVKTEFTGFGIRQKEVGLYVCIKTANKKESGLNIYNNDFSLYDSITFSPELSTGNVFCVLLPDTDLSGYYFKIFDGKEEYCDAYSEAVYGLEEFGRAASKDKLYSFIPTGSEIKNWDKDCTLKTPYSDSVFYIAHPRGLTMLDDKAGDFKGTFKGIETISSELKRLGITAVIFMPSYERIENEIKENNVLSYREKKDSSKINYWGFGDGFYYAPKASFASSGTANVSAEFKEMVMTLHKKGIEVILTFDFNNLPYYEVADILRYWIYNYHVDGFRIFGVSDVYKLINDPFFKETKLLLENYTDISNLPVTYKNIGVFDDEFKNTARKFLKGDDDCVGRMSFYVRENHNNYAVMRNITDFDGFTLADLVSYDSKHNEANDEDNADGTNYNHSWNCGEEGASDKKNVVKLRLQQLKNAICLIMLSQGSPVLNSGDEVLNSQDGNNNPYCQDNEIGWVSPDNGKMAKDIRKFVKDIIEFRKEHVILHQPNELKLFDYMSCKLPDVSFHAEEAWKYNSNPESRQFAVLYAGDYAKQYTGKKEKSIYIVYNLHWEDKEFALPNVHKGSGWKLLFRTDLKCDFNESRAVVINEKKYLAKGRTVTVFVENDN